MKDLTDSYIHTILPAQLPDGAPIMSVLAKRTYTIEKDGSCVLSNEQEPLIGADLYYDNKDPVTASCLKESDFIPYKVATDVVFIGKAYTPGGRAVKVMEVSLSVEKFTKKILVIGNRKSFYTMQNRIKFSEPEPFAEMEIRYENAYGGVDLVSFGSEAPMIYPRNFLGKGFIVKKDKKVVDNTELPNLEDPTQRLTPENICTENMEEWQKQPLPQGYGWFGKLWYPRCSFAGVLPAYMSLYDEIREASFGLIPKDQVEQFKKFKLPMLDFKFFSGASLGLSFPYLNGNETIQLINLDISGTLNLKLPGKKPIIGIDLGEGFQYPEVVMHTVCILKEENIVYILWRGAVNYAGPEKMDSIKKMDVTIQED